MSIGSSESLRLSESSTNKASQNLRHRNMATSTIKPTTDVYSTTERIVGTWIDGKPIYEKSGTSNHSAGEAKLLVSAPNSKIISVTGAFKSTDNYQMPIPYYSSASDYVAIYTDPNGDIIVRTGKAGETLITARYVKTS